MNNGVQVFRGILFLGILSFHCGLPFADLGWGGIETFLLMSAYFLTVKFVKSERMPPPSRQILRRYRRLVVAYFPVLILGVIYAAMKQIFPYDFPFHIIFGQNILWMFTEYQSPMAPLTAHTWTLSIDFLLGILWMVCIWRFSASHLTKKHLKWFSITMIVIAIVWRETGVLLLFDDMLISCCPLTHADAFAIGTLIAVYDREKSKMISFMIGGIGLIGIFATIKTLADMTQCNYMEAYSLIKNSSLRYDNVITCNLYLYLSLFTGAIFKVLIDFPLTINPRNWFVLMGNVSYELYLFHWPLYVIVRRFITNLYLKTIIVFMLALIGVWIFKKIEKRILVEGMI